MSSTHPVYGAPSCPLCGEANKEIELERVKSSRPIPDPTQEHGYGEIVCEEWVCPTCGYAEDYEEDRPDSL